MFHRLCTVALALLFGTTVLLWARSYLRLDNLDGDWRGSDGRVAYTYAASSNRGQFGLCVGEYDEPQRVSWPHRLNFSSCAPEPTDPSFFYMSFWSRHLTRWDQNGKIAQEGDAPGVLYAFGFPYWAPAILWSALPLLWGWRRLSASLRARQGRCLGCGYDLCATPDRCPECGRTSMMQIQTDSSE